MGKSKRDDFTKATTEALAKRVGDRCSNPSCRKPTAGPRSDPTKAINIGVAAHITAASAGGPRYDAALTSEQRKHPDNGIWLCQNCAKLIDNDPDRYPATLIRQWKAGAEQAALDGIEHGMLPQETSALHGVEGSKAPAGLKRQRRALAQGTAPPPPTLIVGRGAAMAEMRARLAGPAATTVLTAVRGWPGVGKTTLAAALAHDDELSRAFPDGVLWVALGPDTDSFRGLGSWLTALGVDPRDMSATDERSGRLAALLRNRRMLLIVDDVWEATQARPFCVGGLDCRTLVTTRYPEVARDLGVAEQGIYRLEVLSDDASADLLRGLAPDAVAKDPEGTLHLARELEGLPLALRVAGGLLAAETALGWGIGDLLRELAKGRRILEERVPADLTNLASQTRPTVSVLLAKSTDRLDDVTRHRFALLGAFVPKPATFDGAAVAAVWQVDDPKPTLRLLVDRGLIEPAGGGRFQMHALLAVHALALCDE